jgi:AraC-like DNA-binding protein/mannose-6-phosphate isomerase-like protein (cupin superfamily)
MRPGAKGPRHRPGPCIPCGTLAASYASRKAGESLERESICRFLVSVPVERVHLRFCERFDEQSRIWNLDCHSHPYFELIFFLEGKADIDAGHETVNVRGFDVVIYPPGLLHTEHLDLSHRQEIICLWADTGPCPPFDHAIKLMDDRGTIRELFEMIYAEFTAARPLASELIARYVQVLFLQVRQHFSEAPRESNSLVERSLAYIHENYDRDFDIDTLAAAISVSPSYLFRLFKRKMQLTPMHYRNVIRIDKAKLLLVDQTLTVDAVADRVGFGDPKYFARVFKELSGTSPSAYRKANLAV